MARYFFDVQDGPDFVKDEDGHDCAAISDVRIAAMKALPAMIGARIPDGDGYRVSVIVRDDEDHAIYRASLTLESTWLSNRDGQ
ncbi:hypothetical protein SAMN06297251_10336 [Fulvimarina manganoxydans]|uniref:DUF6894 domain-containing protein n=1 Tax=Fulvimarina manganoxydans TaxID=937218 RepID=A0A1W1ZPY1_9HYPH|nr:hypothetical protein [Fulvimarina manganoxydans]SMC50479.1 hypothetical protein SAMN06297251_10336 [Fulvimarina manganoxydans]